MKKWVLIYDEFFTDDKGVSGFETFEDDYDTWIEAKEAMKSLKKSRGDYRNFVIVPVGEGD
jgi:hypothetical protein